MSCIYVLIHIYLHGWMDGWLNECTYADKHDCLSDFLSVLCM